MNFVFNPFYKIYKPKKIITITLDNDTRATHLPKFPINKYTTFYCVMKHLDVIPMDIIRYIIGIICDTDQIHFRLLISEMLLSLFNITQLNIQFPANCNLTFEELHEATLMKIFKIIVYPNKFRTSDYDCYYYYEKFTHPNRQYHSTKLTMCATCNNQTKNISNCISICENCRSELKSHKHNVIVGASDYFYDEIKMKTRFEDLKTITYYKCLEYDSTQETLVYISKEDVKKTNMMIVETKSILREEKNTYKLQKLCIDSRFYRTCNMANHYMAKNKILSHLNTSYKNFTTCIDQFDNNFKLRPYMRLFTVSQIKKNKKALLQDLKQELAEVIKANKHNKAVLDNINVIINDVVLKENKKIDNKILLKHTSVKNKTQDKVWKFNNIKNKVRGNKYGGR
jgi:hypothetical protein